MKQHHQIELVARLAKVPHRFDDHSLVARVRSIHSVHQVVLRRVDASISQAGHHVYTSHPIWNQDVGDAEREVARLFRLDP